MDEGLVDLPQSKWDAAGRQVILKGDFSKIEQAILQTFTLGHPPNIVYADATAITVPATADDIAPVMMLGFPSVLHPGMFITGGLTDGKYRENTSDAVMDFDVPASLWGTEKASQWYMIYAIAGNADPDFDLKAMPIMRIKSQATQTISLGTLTTPATGIGYGFSANELAGAKIYMISGASIGLVRTISANNDDNTTGGTLTYTGTALSVAEGDWAVILPNTNFRWLGDIFNNSSQHILQFDKAGLSVRWIANNVLTTNDGVVEDIRIGSPLARFARVAIHYTSPPGIFGHADANGNNDAEGDTYGTWEDMIQNCQFKIVSTDNKGIGFRYAFM